MTGVDRQRPPLEGVVVADLTRILAGPLCTMVLADLGADVMKIERPVTGDDTRSWGPPFVEGDAAYFLSINRNKRSIALDLTNPGDLSVAKDIIARADVLVENFRPGVMGKFGLGYEQLRADNPGLIYCSIPAFAFAGHRDLPGYDLLMQATSGFMSITGEVDREPVKMGVAILDVVAGLYGAIAILAALHDRGDDGQGRLVEVGLFEASVASLVNQAANYLVGGIVPTAAGNAHPNIVPYQAFTASDGQFVLAAANDKLFRAACLGMGREDLAHNPRFASNPERVNNREELIAEMDRSFDEQGVQHWIKIFEEVGVPAAPVRSIDEVFDSPEGESMIREVIDRHRGVLRLMGSPMQFDGIPEGEPLPPPLLGEHEAEIRAWIESTAPAGSGGGQ
jgi:crotonobetainyl-CoA:carnitine CoA-transferase CaiB-like acyl-CoA transferase